MDDLVATTDAIHRYADVSAVMAVETATAGAANQAATVAAAIPVFGLIGQDFLAAFAYAQANNLMSVTELATVHAGTALTAHESAALYDMTEDVAVAEFGSLGRGT